ncbi:MAG: hypothetical protein K0U38_09350 [Epsilonproteobacteria bacterium]|nr:hypothetical protein [Campylobacterota bacterium]
MLKKILLMGVMLALGVLYYYTITVNIIFEHKGSTVKLVSHIPQTIKLHVVRINQSASLTCNGVNIKFINQKKPDYFYHGEEELIISLHRGENQCKSEALKLTMKQKISMVDFMVLFLLWGVPIYVIIYTLFIGILNKIRSQFHA